MSALLRGVVIALGAATLAGCIAPEPVTITPIGLNPAFRPDRAAPTAQQLQQSQSPEALESGPWRTAPDQVAAPLTPTDPLAANLPQSDCWFLARDPGGGGDALRAHWEGVFEFPDLDRLGFSDPLDGRLDIGTCRFDDPQTREPLHLDGVPQQVKCEEVLHVDLRGVLVMPLRGYAQCDIDHLRVHALRLTARRIEGGGGRHSRCAVARSAARRDEPVVRDVDGYTGVVLDGQLATCTDPRGELLFPAKATRYAADLGPGAQDIGPISLPRSDGSTVARELASEGGARWGWSTPARVRAGGARWEENFSSNLRVLEATVFELPPGADADSDTAVERAYAGEAAELCIEDGMAGSCRWRCRDTRPGDGALAFDLAGGVACRDAAGAPSTPVLTPTFAIDTATAGVPATPLRWRMELPGARRPWLRFKLAALGPTGSRGAGLRAAPGRAVVPPARVGRTDATAVLLESVGGHPVRVTRVAVAPAPRSAHPQDFRARVVGDAQPLSLPLEFLPVSATKGEAWLDAEFGGLLRTERAAAHLLLHREPAPPAGLGLVALGHRWLREAGSIPVDVAGPINNPAATRPFVRSTYAARALPFVLPPGARAELLVDATPSAIGTRSAVVRVDWESTVDPAQRGSVEVAVSVVGRSGAVLSLMPGTLRIPADAAGQRTMRSLLLANDGDLPTRLGAPRLQAAGGAVLPVDSALVLELPEGGAGTLAPSTSRIARVHFTGRCDRTERAELYWPGSDGDVVLPIEAVTACGSP